ncbi:MAG: sucC, partial [Francisellaceae bacterium]|nr:sucC [Francisellaceae bacterium]
MNLHEYQAKALFAEYGLPVPHGIVIRSLEEALLAVTQLKTNQWVVKAQVHAGGRGKAGGVKLVSNKDELNGVIKNLLHTRLITQQTNHLGQPINELLIEETSEIQKEMYLGVVIDRSSQKIVIMASTEGGVDIEKVARETPEKIIKIMIDPAIGVSPYQAREIAFGLGLQNDQIKQFTDIVLKLYQLFLEKDLSLVEINPLVITQSLALICLDAKVNIDENALFRQTALRAIRDTSQEDER